MKALARRLVIAGSILSWGQMASAQTVDEIVEKHLAAIGGRAALAEVTSRSTRGTILLSTPEGEISGPVEVLNEAPNKTRTLVMLDLTAVGAGKMTYDERFDGTTGYVMDSFQGNRDLTGNQLENLRNEVFPTPFLTYKERGDTLELVGKEMVREREAYALILRPRSGPAIRRYIDSESYQEVRLVQQTETPQTGPFEQTLDLFDFRNVDGLTLPFQMKATSAFQTFTVNVAGVEHNVTIDTSLFAGRSTDRR